MLNPKFETLNPDFQTYTASHGGLAIHQGVFVFVFPGLAWSISRPPGTGLCITCSMQSWCSSRRRTAKDPKDLAGQGHMEHVMHSPVTGGHEVTLETHDRRPTGWDLRFSVPETTGWDLGFSVPEIGFSIRPSFRM